MKKVHAVFLSLCILVMAAMPAQAFTANSLTIKLADNGDAEMDMQYELSFLEQTAVFFQIANPADELKDAFDSHSSAEVTVPEATDSSAIVLVPLFADISAAGEKTTMITPELSFERAQQVMDEYWFASLVSPDFSPGVTTVIFPDGHKDIYYEALTIPSVSHVLNS
jgi:ATP/maltotriose-dependent transcriptional regulator MalT